MTDYFPHDDHDIANSLPPQEFRLETVTQKTEIRKRTTKLPQCIGTWVNEHFTGALLTIPQLTARLSPQFDFADY